MFKTEQHDGLLLLTWVLSFLSRGPGLRLMSGLRPSNAHLRCGSRVITGAQNSARQRERRPLIRAAGQSGRTRPRWANSVCCVCVCVWSVQLR